MYESKLLVDYLEEKPESQVSDKDYLIGSAIRQIRVYQYSIIQGVLGVMGVFVLMAGLVSYYDKGKLETVVIVFVGIWLSIILAGVGLSRFAGRKDLLIGIHKLFHLLSHKPYEIRVKWDRSSDKKIKVMIEENLLVDSHHVLKEKSKHFTAYIDHKADPKSIVRFVMNLVKEAETRFK